MDLTGNAELKHEYVHDEGTGITTITFKGDGDVNLGTLQIETARYREFMRALFNISKEGFDELTPTPIKPRTVYDSRTLTATSSY